MILNVRNRKIYIKPGSTDMRKQINGLSIQVQEIMKKDPFAESFFVFCNKQKRLLKILCWEKNGFWLFTKRLEKDRFPWPESKKEVKEIDSKEFTMLLEGIDFFGKHKELSFSKVS